jgi:hypothetical protein
MLLNVHILRKVLMYQYKGFRRGKSKAYTINYNNSMAPTIYKLEKLSVSIIYSKTVLVQCNFIIKVCFSGMLRGVC